MAITYPLALPTNIGIGSIQLRATNAVAYSRSPFTFAGQAHAYSGEIWEADVTLPPLNKTDAEAWIAFLMSLRGQHGTFYLNDPSGTSLSSGSAPNSLAITGAAGARSVTATMTGTLLAGDYFSLGTGADMRLYKVLADKTNSGTLEIWPALRATASSATADITSASGVFRLSANQQAWTINNANIFGITFGAMEVV